ERVLALPERCGGLAPAAGEEQQGRPREVAHHAPPIPSSVHLAPRTGRSETMRAVTRYSFRDAPHQPETPALPPEQIFVCPQCRAALEPGVRGELRVLRCTGAHAEQPFPLIDGALPVLLEAPMRYLARACLSAGEGLRAN